MTLVSCDDDQLGLVVIGRNEGERLACCLISARPISRKVYVDSGSMDDSVVLARREGVQVVELPVPPVFTAARARNAGLTKLLTDHPEIEFVQMVDGDCELQPQWISAALAALRADPNLAAVFGRRRERYPYQSVYNALCDDEWNLAVGEAAACGGDALFRISALREVEFYNPKMIAAEDTEMSIRLRKRGWRIRRINAEMTLHDAALTRFRQWWNRIRRSGHGFGEMAFLHPDWVELNLRRSVRSIVIWGGLLPIVLLASVALAVFVDSRMWIASAALVLMWSVRVVQLAVRQRRRGLSARLAQASGFLMMIGKISQMAGLIGYHIDRISGRASRIIEYKGPPDAQPS